MYVQRSATPTRTCNQNNEGDSVYNPVDPSTVWLCESSVWKPHRYLTSCKTCYSHPCGIIHTHAE